MVNLLTERLETVDTNAITFALNAIALGVSAIAFLANATRKVTVVGNAKRAAIVFAVRDKLYGGTVHIYIYI